MEEQDDNRMDAFDDLNRAAVSLQSDEEDLEEVIKNELLAWKRCRDEKVKKPQFPANYRYHLVTLFIKYNTELSSSGAVERLFSTAGDVLRLERSCLSKAIFKHLVFLKRNLHLVKPKFKVLRVVGKDEDML